MGECDVSEKDRRASSLVVATRGFCVSVYLTIRDRLRVDAIQRAACGGLPEAFQNKWQARLWWRRAHSPQAGQRSHYGSWAIWL
jgi:hypothetical protein